MKQAQTGLRDVGLFVFVSQSQHPFEVTCQNTYAAPRQDMCPEPLFGMLIQTQTDTLKQYKLSLQTRNKLPAFVML